MLLLAHSQYSVVMKKKQSGKYNTKVLHVKFLSSNTLRVRVTL